MGIFGVKTGKKGLKMGFGVSESGGRLQKWPFLASKLGGGAPKMRILRLQNGGQSQKIGFF